MKNSQDLLLDVPPLSQISSDYNKLITHQLFSMNYLFKNLKILEQSAMLSELIFVIIWKLIGQLEDINNVKDSEIYNNTKKVELAQSFVIPEVKNNVISLAIAL